MDGPPGVSRIGPSRDTRSGCSLALLHALAWLVILVAIYFAGSGGIR